MPNVNKIKLPDNSEYNIKDYRIPGVDTTPTSGSDNVVTSGGVYDAIEASPDTKNTAGATNTTDKIYVVGSKTQGDNPQTYTNINVYEQNGELTASKFNGPLETSYTDTTNNLSMYKSVGLNKKVYTGVLGVANGSSSPNNNTYANQSVYFLTIHPTSWDAEWSIKYKLNIHLDNESQLYKSSSTASTVNAGANTRGIYDCNINGTAGTYSTFHIFQSQKNTSYRPIYYHMFHSTTSAGFATGKGHKIGVCFYSSYLPTPTTDYSSGSAVGNTKYTRTIEVIVEEAINCTFKLADTLEVEGDAYRSDYDKLDTTFYTTNTSSSNSAGRWINLSATTQGLYESGDDNTYTYTQQSSNYTTNATKSGNTGVKLWSYPLIGFDKDGNALGISVYSSSQSSSTTSISAKGTRLYCTEGFDYTKGIRYVSTSSSFAYNADMNVSTQTNYSGVDLRYSDNCVPSDTANNLGLVNRKPVYLRGTIGNDGLFYLAPIDVTYNNSTYQRAWVQDIPSVQNEDGEYVYWFIGYPYNNSTYPASLYQLNLITQSELVWYKDGSIRPCIPPQSITETDPVFSASAAAGITSSDITGWNNKVSNVQSDWNATTGLGVILNKPTIPAAVTESTVSGWGFTKNAGTLTGVNYFGVDAAVNNGVANIAPYRINIDKKYLNIKIAGDCVLQIVTHGNDGIYTDAIAYHILVFEGMSYGAGPGVFDSYTVKGFVFTNGDTSSLFDVYSSYYEHYDSFVYKQEGNNILSITTALSHELSLPIAYADITVINGIPPLEYETSDVKPSGQITSVLTWSCVGMDNEYYDYDYTTKSIVATHREEISRTLVSAGQLVLDGDGLTGVSFNGSPATVTNGVASITATIPAAVTESTVSGWGFTKNTGTLTDVTVGGTSVVSNGTAAVPAIPIEIINIGSVDFEEDTTLPSGTYTQCSTAVTAGKTVVLYIPNDSVLYLSGVDTGSSALSFFASGTNAFQVHLYNNDTFSVDWVAEDNWNNYINTVKVNGTALIPDINNAIDITVPATVTESTVSGWGFTKNTGTYSKPSGGIPATDLASAVQTSLGKADTALQSFTETDPTVPTWAKQSTKPTYTAAEVGALPDTTIIPTVPTNVSAFTNDANYLKYVLCADEAAYNAITTKDSGTLYLIPE